MVYCPGILVFQVQTLGVSSVMQLGCNHRQLRFRLASPRRFNKASMRHLLKTPLCFLCPCSRDLSVKSCSINSSFPTISVLNVFSESQTLITLLKSKEKNVWIQGILFDIYSLSNLFTSIFVPFYPACGENSIADTIAKSVLLSLASSPILDE